MQPNPLPDAIALRDVSVLVVEDVWHVAKAMKEMLERLGMKVWGPSATAKDARLILVDEGPPRIALVDVNLKGEMAWDLIEELHELGVDVVVMSGYPLLNDPRGRPLTCLQKPYDAMEIIAILNEIIAKGEKTGRSRGRTIGGE
jgi:DNA-binding NtrC family response regulator